MTAVTFDTLELTSILKQSGIQQEQAEAIVKAIVKSHEELVTKGHLDLKVAPIYTDLAVLKWMMGLLLGGVVSIMLKLFLP
jgi:hypothetical protein